MNQQDVNGSKGIGMEKWFTNWFRVRLCSLVALTVCVCLSGAVGAEKEATADAEKVEEKSDKQAKQAKTLEELTIQADTVEMDFNNRSAVFTGSVHVEDPGMTLDADKMTIFLKEGNELRRIEAVGNVIIREVGTEKTASSGKAVYDVDADTVTLSDNPSLIEADKGMITEAAEMVYKRGEQKFLFTGRPKFRLYVPKGKDKGSPTDMFFGTPRGKDGKGGKDDKEEKAEGEGGK